MMRDLPTRSALETRVDTAVVYSVGYSFLKTTYGDCSVSWKRELYRTLDEHVHLT